MFTTSPPNNPTYSPHDPPCIVAKIPFRTMELNSVFSAIAQSVGNKENKKTGLPLFYLVSPVWSGRGLNIRTCLSAIYNK